MNHSLLTLLQPEAQTPPRIRHASSVHLVSSDLQILSRNEARKRDEIWDVRQKTLQNNASWGFTAFQRTTSRPRRRSRSKLTSHSQSSAVSARSMSTSST